MPVAPVAGAADAVSVIVDKATHDGVDIAYERCGSAGGEPMLLVMGLGMQMIFWADEFCAALAQRGFDVVRFDNRDVGLSSHFHEAGAPSPVANEPVANEPLTTGSIENGSSAHGSVVDGPAAAVLLCDAVVVDVDAAAEQ
jgi:pimeloyl-ACP methyl ester carboxylesterase